MNEADLNAERMVVGSAAWRGNEGLIHGTTTREGWPREGKGDLFEAFAALRAQGLLPEGMPVVGAEQIHEDRIGLIESFKAEPGAVARPHTLRVDEAAGWAEFPRTDALLTVEPGVVLAIRTADCLPVFLIDPVQRACGLAHCGWRGMLAGLTGHLARAMIERGSKPEALSAWFGPCIRAPQYEVGTELVSRFEDAFPGLRVSPEGTHLDLPAVARGQLRGCGLHEERIHDSGACTRAEAKRYHSYRAEGERSGRMISFLGWHAERPAGLERLHLSMT